MPATIPADLTAEETWLTFRGERPERGVLDLFDFVCRYGDVQTALLLLMAVEEAGAEAKFREYLTHILAGMSAHEALDALDGR